MARIPANLVQVLPTSGAAADSGSGKPLLPPEAELTAATKNASVMSFPRTQKAPTRRL